MKRRQLGNVIIVCIAIVLVQIKIGAAPEKMVSPTNTAFCFDFNILAQPDRMSERFGYAKILIKNPMIATLLFKSDFWEDVSNARKGILIDGIKPLYTIFDKLEYLQKKYWPFSEDVKKEVLKIRAHYHLNEDVILLLKQLKKRGFELYILTNLDYRFLKEYVKPYIEAEYQVNFNELFSNYFCPEDGVDKSSPDFYKRVARYINPNGKKQLMLIDTKTYYFNIAKECNEGYIVHLYTTTKRLLEDEIMQQAFQ